MRPLPSSRAMGERAHQCVRARTKWSVDRLSKRPALDDLDARAPRIGNVGDHIAGWARARGLVELDAVGFELLHEGGMVLHIEADVVEHAMPGRGLRRVGFGEA